jgi:pimeloyl-ACP methyl ester carboxylesterase
MTLNFQTYGKGTPLIILHGLFGMLDNWHSVAKMLAEYFQVFVLDQRNHGRSPHSSVFGYDAMADDVCEFATQRHISSCFLLGHSMGGKVAMTAALKYQDLFSKLVVIDIAPRAYPSFHDTLLQALTALNLGNFTSRQAIDDALAVTISEAPVRQFLMKNLSRDSNGSFHWKMNLPVLSANYHEVLREVKSEDMYTKPTLFIRSLQSSYINERDIADIKRIFPRAIVEDFKTGHWVHAEAPDQLTRTVAQFFLRQDL